MPSWRSGIRIFPTFPGCRRSESSGREPEQTTIVRDTPYHQALFHIVTPEMERVAWPQGIAPPVSTPIGWIRPLGVALLLQTLLIPTVPVHATVLTPYGVEGEAREGRVTAMPAGLPVALASAPGRHLVLMRQQRQLLVMEDGRMLRSFPVAVGMPGWETPSGTFEVLEKIPDPIWQHPESGSSPRRAHQSPRQPLDRLPPRLRWPQRLEWGEDPRCEGMRGDGVPRHPPPLDRGPCRFPWLRAPL